MLFLMVKAKTHQSQLSCPEVTPQGTALAHPQRRQHSEVRGSDLVSRAFLVVPFE